jgi:hypothetical protein
MATSSSEDPIDYRMQTIDSLASIDERRWNDLVEADRTRRAVSGEAIRRAAGQPFVSHAFLNSLETSGSVGGRTGWTPHHLLLFDQRGALRAAAPMYRKSHSYGEYVFDWAWADAYQCNGLRYYPKLLAAIPFTPVPGPRLIAADASAHRALARALVDHAGQARVSSLHVLFPEPDDARELAAAGMMIRNGVQFHWQRRGERSFDDYLASLQQAKRKKVRAERRKVAEQGVQCQVFDGTQLDAVHWRLMRACYVNTYLEHGSSPYLTDAFFAALAGPLRANVALSIAHDAHGPFAAALLMHDTERVYGRYWGAIRHRPFVHFEVSYYAPLAWAIEGGLTVFEGGAQGEHKLARGFAPVRTMSAHWLAHPAFADAVERFLERERDGVDGYLDELAERLPLKAVGTGGAEGSASSADSD